MNTFNPASLVNLLGFTVGVMLYVLLFAMTVRHRRTKRRFSFDFLLLTTSVLGFLWNIGELFVFIWKDFSAVEVSPVLLAVSYSALGFLPPVVVHSAWKNSENLNLRWLTLAAYALSIFASLLHFQSAIFAAKAPSDLALRFLTFGSLALLVSLLILAFRQRLEKKAVWITALLIFAVSALHLSSQAEENSWLVELVAHQSSLPLALAILLQDYRFAFADLFLKRALSLLLLASLAFGLYVYVAVPLLAWHETHDRNDVQAAVIVLALWIATALAYPNLHKFAVWLVDKIILRRANYEELQTEIARSIEKSGGVKAVLEEVCDKLAAALTAKKVSWTEILESDTTLPAVNFSSVSAEIFVPAAETPFYEIHLGDFAGGRKLLSDEIQMLEAVALLAARRIDNLRAEDERYAQEIRAQQFSKLATEAQLRALRAQINPHFLFNALTTIGYLIQTAPEKAFSTLMKLTQLLRGILRAGGEFSTLGEEINLIENYLEIEKARFEERLSVKIEVPRDLQKTRVPALILQPLVENAIKHGISKAKSGGEVCIKAKLENEKDTVFLRLSVFDSGAGVSEKALTEARESGLGLNNIEQRLRSYYGKTASLEIKSETGKGTTAEIKFPISGAGFIAETQRHRGN
ncbi:MAG TPA: histidine kinase [Pyrinomonadaceae bacterium]|jgi:signal transduction histidine kinase